MPEIIKPYTVMANLCSGQTTQVGRGKTIPFYFFLSLSLSLNFFPPLSLSSFFLSPVYFYIQYVSPSYALWLHSALFFLPIHLLTLYLSFPVSPTHAFFISQSHTPVVFSPSLFFLGNCVWGDHFGTWPSYSIKPIPFLTILANSQGKHHNVAGQLS